MMAMMMNKCRHFIFCPAMPVTIEIRNKTPQNSYGNYGNYWLGKVLIAHLARDG